MATPHSAMAQRESFASADRKAASDSSYQKEWSSVIPRVKSAFAGAAHDVAKETSPMTSFGAGPWEWSCAFVDRAANSATTSGR
jgi:hypothetical protein